MPEAIQQPVEVEVPELLKTAQPLAKRKVQSKLSISAALNQSERSPAANHSVANKENLPANHFTETDLQNEWQIFLSNLQQRDAVKYNAISIFKLQKSEENCIKVVYPSESAKDEFESIREEFFNHFRHKVSNYSIQLEYQIDRALKVEPITKRKIFDKFAQINPLLTDLDELMKFDFN